MIEANIVVGVDAGGSKTRVIVANGNAEVLAEVVGSGAAVIPGNAGYSADLIATLVRTALDSAEHAGTIPSVLCVGAAGAGREAEQLALQDALTSLEIADEVVVETLDATK